MSNDYSAQWALLGKWKHPAAKKIKVLFSFLQHSPCCLDHVLQRFFWKDTLFPRAAAFARSLRKITYEPRADQRLWPVRGCAWLNSRPAEEQPQRGDHSGNEKRDAERRRDERTFLYEWKKNLASPLSVLILCACVHVLVLTTSQVMGLVLGSGLDLGLGSG